MAIPEGALKPPIPAREPTPPQQGGVAVGVAEGVNVPVGVKVYVKVGLLVGVLVLVGV